MTKVKVLLIFLLVTIFSSQLAFSQVLLYDNGPLVTHQGVCDGNDASRLQDSSLSMNTLGFGHQAALGYRIADNFTIPEPESWFITEIIFYAYQTGSPTSPSPITAVNYRIWNGPPNDPNSQIIYGNDTTNRLISSVWSGIYRDSEDSPCLTNRPIMENRVSAEVTLGPGTYWIDWQTDGSGSYPGPWAPPITILGQTTTGDALQYTGSWASALDLGTSTPQGFPFKIYGISTTVTLKLLRPNGGERWKAGYKYAIKWEAPTNADKFTLRYSTDNKSTWTNIKTVLASNCCTNDRTKLTCTYGWTIPAQDGRKPKSFVRVVARDSANQTIGKDDSDKAFVIEVLKVTSPNGGETLQAGTTHTITWETYLTKEVAKVILQYSTDGGSTWKGIKAFTGTNPGQYDWTVPNTPSTNCKVKVTLKDSAGANITADVSDKVFTIQ